ncbi:MAG: hypothetical protein GY906_40685 [bacterium]|nr:hypothetical protein [bacterium]
MWHALRAELAYSRPFLLGGLGIATGVATLLTVVFVAVGDDGPPDHVTSGLRGVFLIMAPMIVGFITQSYRFEERRARLLLSGPLKPRQIVGATVLLPVVLFAIGIVASGLVIGVGALVTGRFEYESLNIVGFVGGQLFAYTQIGILAQEATAARAQRRLRASFAGWAVLVVVIVLLAMLYVVLAMELLTWTHLILGHLVVSVMAMMASVSLYEGRTDFTR